MAATTFIVVITQSLLMMISISGNLELFVEAVYDWTQKDFQCTENTYTDSSGMGSEINTMTEFMIHHTNPRPYPQYLCAVPDLTEDGPYAWGGSSCTDRITQSDCTDCLTYASGKMTDGCPYHSGAYILLADCSMRFFQLLFAMYRCLHESYQV